MPDLALAIVVAALAVIFVQLRRQRQTHEIIRELRAGADERSKAPGPGISMEDMQGLVDELAGTLRPTSQVIAQSHPFPPHHPSAEPGHIWSSPCGKRVYIN